MSELSQEEAGSASQLAEEIASDLLDIYKTQSELAVEINCSEAQISRLINLHLPAVIKLINRSGRKVVSKDDRILHPKCAQVGYQRCKGVMEILKAAVGNGPVIKDWEKDLRNQGVYDD